MKASDLSLPSLSKVEKENVQAMTIWRTYKTYLNYAKKAKVDYLEAKAMQKVKTSEALDRIVAMYKESAIEYWNTAQEYLAKHQEFEKNRKYPNV